jgi:hypothetical protein
MTEAPSFANNEAIAEPIPLELPVTIAVFPCNLTSNTYEPNHLATVQSDECTSSYILFGAWTIRNNQNTDP